MKCWCFNQEQLDAALRQYLAVQPNMEIRSLTPGLEVAPLDVAKVVRDFLASPQAREHKLVLDGMWDLPPVPSAGPPISLPITVEMTAARAAPAEGAATFHCFSHLVAEPGATAATPTGDPKDEGRNR